MQIFLVLGMSLIMVIFGSNQWNKFGTSSSDSVKISASASASNYYMFNDFSIQYLYDNYDTIMNNPLNVYVNNVSYLTANDFDINKLSPYYSNYLDFKSFYTYKGTYFLYSKTNNSGGDVPQLYLLTTFDSNDDFKVRNMFGIYNNFLSSKTNPGEVNYWSSSIFGIYNGSNTDSTILSTLPNGVSSNMNNILKNSVFRTLTNANFKMGKYFMIIPVTINN